MKKTLYAALLAAPALFLFSCETDDDTGPVVVEPELITTLAVNLKDGSTGFDRTFIYKVENGFGSGGSVQIDTMALRPGTIYTTEMTVTNEAADPDEDITEEIRNESNDHLFLFRSDPGSGAGSVTFSEGSTDANGQPFNLQGKLTTGAAGSGTLTITLLHEPTSKTGTTPDAAGGETDLEATFPVRIQP